ncbi:hypothetical protein [Nocardia noduli]|uniref:hypothetical protein n=1 Tax=Nocardia noduli TaxID=2815722 RepID=UPI001C249F39|nr:hypothetical protein [Nocardia noduli]
MRAETAYHGEMGKQFAALATDNAYNAHTDRPAMLRLAGDVRGLRVSDLGCGAGHYGAELLKRGPRRSSESREARPCCAPRRSDSETVPSCR